MWGTIGLIALGTGGFALPGIIEAGGDRTPSDSAADTASTATPTGSVSIPAKILRYAERLVRQYDTNGDSRLQKDEWEKVRGNPRSIDADRDGVINVDEFAQHIRRYGQLHRIHLFQLNAEAAAPASLFRPAGNGPSREPSGEEKAEPSPIDIAGVPEMPGPAAAEGASDRVVRRGSQAARKYHVSRANLPPGLPEWFTARDADGDGQITMAEFAPNPSRADILEFNRYDTNHDGVITARELLGLAKSKPADKSAR